MRNVFTGTRIVLAVGLVLTILACGSPDSSRAASSALPWEESLDGALRRATAENKLVMVFFYTDWCGWCRKMDDSTFADGRVQQAMARLVPVRLNAEKNGRAEAARFRVNSYPNIAFLDASGKQVARIPGFMPAPAFLEELGDVLAAATAR